MDRPTDRCETVAEVLELLSGAKGPSWQSFLQDLMDAGGLTYARFAAACGIGRGTLRRWCTQGGAPRSRDTFLRVGLGAAMEPAAVSAMLSRYGGYCGLNPRDPFDAAVIFCLRRRSAGDARFDYGAAEALYARLLPAAAPPGPSQSSTTKLMAKLLTIDTEAEFQAFFRDFGQELSGRKTKLERYLGEFLTVRRLEAGREAGRAASLHSLRLPPEAEKQLSALKRHGIVPRRRQLIALGLLLDMTLEELDLLLTYAGMEPLYARDRLEAVLIYALQTLALTHPELALGNATALLAVTRDPATRRRCTELAQEYWQACYRSEDDDVQSVAQYVREILEQLDLEDARELLALLGPAAGK